MVYIKKCLISMILIHGGKKMPIYEYECEDCGHRMEVKQNISDPPLSKCQECSGRIKKLITPPTIIFKGSGWYVTDFPTKDRKEGIEKEKGTTKDKKSEKQSKVENKETVKA
jgi:putative FmdB family regulatory protein